jgi:hypothetical protein
MTAIYDLKVYENNIPGVTSKPTVFFRSHSGCLDGSTVEFETMEQAERFAVDFMVRQAQEGDR